MGRKIMNNYAAPTEEEGQGGKVHFPVLDVLENSFSSPRELNPNDIDDWGPVDRLEEGVTAVTSETGSGSLASLMESITTSGQRLPILVRPSKKNRNRYEVIYGRRRLKACRELKITVKAYVQDMDDQAALLEKGIENTNRRDLSFYEKALFAENIAEQFKKAADVAEILGTNRVTIQQLKRVTRTVPRQVGQLIGPAPTKGRRQWFQLAEAFESKAITENKAIEILGNFETHTSDQRLDGLLKEISKRGAQSRVAKERSPVNGVKIKTGQGVRLSVQKGPFADWLDQNLDELLRKAHEDFEATGKEE